MTGGLRFAAASSILAQTPREIVRKVNLGFLPFVKFKENVRRPEFCRGGCVAMSHGRRSRPVGWLPAATRVAGWHAHPLHMLAGGCHPAWAHAIVEHEHENDALNPLLGGALPAGDPGCPQRHPASHDPGAQAVPRCVWLAHSMH